MKYNIICAIATVVVGAAAAPVAEPLMAKPLFSASHDLTGIPFGSKQSEERDARHFGLNWHGYDAERLKEKRSIPFSGHHVTDPVAVSGLRREGHLLLAEEEKRDLTFRFRNLLPIDTIIGTLASAEKEKRDAMLHLLSLAPMDTTIGTFAHSEKEKRDAMLRLFSLTPIDTTIGTFAHSEKEKRDAMLRLFSLTPMDTTIGTFAHSEKEKRGLDNEYYHFFQETGSFAVGEKREADPSLLSAHTPPSCGKNGLRCDEKREAVPEAVAHAEAAAEALQWFPGMGQSEICKSPFCVSLKKKRAAEALLRLPSLGDLEKCKGPFCESWKEKRAAEAEPIYWPSYLPPFETDCKGVYCNILKHKREAEAEAILRLPWMNMVNLKGCTSPLCASLK